MNLFILILILVLCLAYSMTKTFNESLEDSQTTSTIDLTGAFTDEMDDTTFCNIVNNYFKTDDEKNKNNVDTMSALDQFKESQIYTVLLNENSHFYSGNKFNCLINKFRTSLDVTNTTKIVDVLNKIIQFLHRIKCGLSSPTDVINGTICKMDYLTDSINRLRSVV